MVIRASRTRARQLTSRQFNPHNVQMCVLLIGKRCTSTMEFRVTPLAFPSAFTPIIKVADGRASCSCRRRWRTQQQLVGANKRRTKKAAGAQLIHRRGNRIPLWAVFQPLQVVLSFACSVASLSRFPSHYLPCQLQLPEAATADYLFDRGNPSTWCAGLTAVHGTSSTTPPFEAQRGTTLPRYYNHFARITFACLDF